jgi:tetrapyrrole methylase family protein/MazG family protein
MSEDSDPRDYVQELVEVFGRLRSPQGCPWDREQTHQSLKNYLVEEACELLDAIDDGDDEAMKDELGDVLLQVVFHCQLARETHRFDLQEVARKSCEKMIRRHPHVFGDGQVHTADGVVDQWEKIKKTEKASAKRTSAVSGVPRHLPALHRASKIQSRAAKVGFDWPSIDGVLAKIDEELAEVREALRNRDAVAVDEEIGDLLFAVTSLSRFQKSNAEELLGHTVKKFERRFRKMEDMVSAENRCLAGCSLEEMEAYWEKAKHGE